jgi:two-component system, OmpR family, phosphate regulon response regulator PhoB
MAQPRVLIIEDEKGLTQTLSWYVEREGYEPIVAHEGPEGLRKAQTILPDIILLDVMLPGLDGLKICQQLKAGERTKDIPIIMMTAKGEENDQVEGYAKGADDYVVKPASNKVLMQKMKVLLKRAAHPVETADVVEHLGVKLDRVRHKVTVEGNALDLTPTEFKLLECLVRQPGRAFTRHQLMDAAIGEGAVVLERTIDVHVKTLRKKLVDAAGKDDDLIETVRGVGYRFKEAEAV